MNLDRYGNTSAASIPIALCEAIQQGRIRPADKLVLVGFGAGLTWAAVALKWGAPTLIKQPAWYRHWFASLQFEWARVRSASLRVPAAGHQLADGADPH